MISSPAKRRKTSLMSPQRRRSSCQESLVRDDISLSSKRASFLSPTKASLARYNPNLLPLKGNQRPTEHQRSDRDMLIDLDPTKVGKRTQILRASSAGPTFTIPAAMPNTNGKGLLSPTMEVQITPSKKPSFPRSECDRASPPEEARLGEDGVHHVLDAGDQRFGSNDNSLRTASAIASDPHPPATPTNARPTRVASGMSLGEDGEPSLPSTPVHLGIEKPPEAPKGLLFSSSKERRRKKDATGKKSSPLKYRVNTTDVEAPSARHKAGNDLARGLGPRLCISNTPAPPPSAHQLRILKMKEDLAKIDKELQQNEDVLICQLIMSNWERLDSQADLDIRRRKKDVKLKCAKVTNLQQDLLQAELTTSATDCCPQQELGYCGFDFET